MKNCIYLTTNKKNSKWYIGSHKNEDNIISKTYIGSGIDISKAIEEEGIDNFDSEVLFTFNTRDDAFKGEHQLLQAFNAKGNDMSYNRTNNSWPNENIFKKIFSAKKGPLTNDQIQSIKNKIGDVVEEDTKSKSDGNSFKEQMELATSTANTLGFQQGRLYASKDAYDREIKTFKIKLMIHVNNQVDLRERDIKIIKRVQEATDVISPTAIVRLTDLEKDLEYFTRERELIKNEDGWCAVVYNSFTKGFNEGSKAHVDALLNEKGLL